MTSRSLPLAVLAVAAVVGWLLLRPTNTTREAPVRIAPGTGAAASGGPTALEGVEQSSQEDRLHADLPSALEPSSTPSQAGTAQALPMPLEEMLVEGLVLWRDTLKPLTDHPVSLTSMIPDRGGSVRTVTDQHGRFSLSIPPAIGAAGDLVQAVLRTLDNKRELHVEVTRLQSSLTLYVAPTATLRGQLLPTTQDDLEGLVVRLQELASDGSFTFLGDTRVQEGGTFQLSARPHDWAEKVNVTVYQKDVPLGIGLTTLAELQSPGGAKITLAVRHLTIEVRDVASQPIAEAKIIVGPLQPGDLNWLGESTTDKEGRAELRLPTTPYEFLVQAPGFRPYSGVTRNRDVETVYLERDPTPDEGLSPSAEGSVVTPQGEAIPEAIVTLTLATGNPELGFRAVSEQVTTGPDGSFRMDLPRRDRYELIAYHSDYGLSAPLVSTLPSDGSPVELVIGPTVPLEVVLSSDATAQPSFDGYLEYVLREVETKQTTQGRWRRPPYLLREVPPGEYIVFIRCPARKSVGRAPILVDEQLDSSARVAIALAIPVAITGTLQFDGRKVSGATLQALPQRTDPDSYPGEWYLAESGAEGHFAIPVPGASPGEPVQITTFLESGMYFDQAILGAEPVLIDLAVR